MDIKKLQLSKLIKLITLEQLYRLKNSFFKLSSKNNQYTQFHSQFGEDRWIFEYINLPKKGVFIDIGAGHPVCLSNTYFFEKNGWKGICIDADPTQYALLKKVRANVEWAAISSTEGEIEFSPAYLPAHSSTLGKNEYKELLKIPFKAPIRVPSFKLETVLTKYNIGTIDILDIDVEGTELEIWKTFDYEKHKPKVVIIEYYTFGLADSSAKIKDFFSKLPYQLVHTTCTNFIFLNSAVSSH